MGNNTIVSVPNPAFRDELSDLARQGAQQIIRQAVEAEYDSLSRLMHALELVAKGREYTHRMRSSMGLRVIRRVRRLPFWSPQGSKLYY